MVLHDPSDIILEVTKLLSYAKWEKVSTGMFVVFMASWFFTRLVYFPFWVVWSTRYAKAHLASSALQGHMGPSGLHGVLPTWLD